jgi:hypothetical protein
MTRKKVANANIMVDALKSLTHSAQNMYTQYNKGWNDYQTYKFNENVLLDKFKVNFENGIRAVLYDLNDLFNMYSLNYGIEMVDPILEEIDCLRNYIEDSEITRAIDSEKRMESL